VLTLLAQGAPGGVQNIVDAIARTPLSKVIFFVALCTVVRLLLASYLMRTPPHSRGLGFTLGRWTNDLMDLLAYAGIVVFMVIRPYGVQAFNIPTGSMLETLQINDYLVINKAIYRYSDPKAGDIVVFRPPARACMKAQLDPNGEPKVDFIKRCIGVPGDLIEIRGGTLYRNGSAVQEPYRNGENGYDFKFVHYQGAFAPWKDRYIPVIYDSSGMPNYQVSIAKEFAIADLKDHEFGGFDPSPSAWKPFDMVSEEEHSIMRELTEAPPARIPAGHFLMLGDNRPGSFDGRAWGLVPRQSIVGRAEFIWWPPSRWRGVRGVSASSAAGASK
jgi:signal peptidase I